MTESELDVNIKVEPEEDIGEDDVSKDDNNDDFVFQTPRSRRRSSLETTPRSSSETTPRSSSETTPSPNRQKDAGEKLRRKNREEKNQEIDLLKEEIKGLKNLVSEKDLKIKELEAELEKSLKKNSCS